jgi:hypothetical protein
MSSELKDLYIIEVRYLIKDGNSYEWFPACEEETGIDNVLSWYDTEEEAKRWLEIRYNPQASIGTYEFRIVKFVRSAEK